MRWWNGAECESYGGRGRDDSAGALSINDSEKIGAAITRLTEGSFET